MWSFWVAVFEQGLALILACLPALRITLRLCYRGERDDGTKNYSSRGRNGTTGRSTLSTKDNAATGGGGDSERGGWEGIGDVEGFAVRLEDVDKKGFMIGAEAQSDDKSDHHQSGGECSSLEPIVDHVVGESSAKRAQS